MNHLPATVVPKPFVIEIHEDFYSTLFLKGRGLVIFNFWASWSVPCERMNQFYVDLCKEFPTVSFGMVEAEKHPALCEAVFLRSVPTFVAFRAGRIVGKLEGADPKKLVEMLTRLLTAPTVGEDLNLRISNLIKGSSIMLFMKGNPQAPRCVYSGEMCKLIDATGVSYKTYDVLEDEEIRQGLKIFNKWPFYPQLFVNNEFVAGLDICKELSQSGELKECLEVGREVYLKQSIEKLKRVVNSDEWVLFLHGTKDKLNSETSEAMCDLLDTAGIEDFTAIDIDANPCLAEAVCSHYECQTFPLLFHHGELVGDYCILCEMIRDGDFDDLLQESIMGE